MKFKVKTFYQRLNNEIRYGDIAIACNSLSFNVDLKPVYDLFALSKMREDHIAMHGAVIVSMKQDLNEKIN